MGVDQLAPLLLPRHFCLDPLHQCVFSSPQLLSNLSLTLLSSVYKGAPSLGLNKLSEGVTAAAIVGTAAVITALAMIFWLPYVYCKVVRKDYSALSLRIDFADSDHLRFAQPFASTTSSWAPFSGAARLRPTPEPSASSPAFPTTASSAMLTELRPEVSF